jgi:hypothetical protein
VRVGSWYRGARRAAHEPRSVGPPEEASESSDSDSLRVVFIRSPAGQTSHGIVWVELLESVFGTPARGGRLPSVGGGAT